VLLEVETVKISPPISQVTASPAGTPQQPSTQQANASPYPQTQPPIHIAKQSIKQLKHAQHATLDTTSVQQLVNALSPMLCVPPLHLMVLETVQPAIPGGDSQQETVFTLDSFDKYSSTIHYQSVY